MARHHEKLIADARQSVAEVGAPTPSVDSMSGDQIASFLAGFGLNVRQVRAIRDRWQEDKGRVSRAVYDEGYDDGYEAASY